MPDPFAPKNPVTIYLTREQIFRLGGLACDALVGIQIHTDDHDETNLTCEMVPVDNSTDMRHYVITPDGSIEDVT